MKQTAVEWLVETFKITNVDLSYHKLIIEQAKQIEKERMLEFGTKVAMKAHTGKSGWSIIEVYNENK